MKKKTTQDNVLVSTIRFSGTEQLRLINQVKQLSNDCGIVYSDLIRSLIAIGLEAYKHGAIVGFDGRVILNHSPTAKDEGKSSQHQNIALDEDKLGLEAEVEHEELTNPQPIEQHKPKKKSLFLE